MKDVVFSGTDWEYRKQQQQRRKEERAKRDVRKGKLERWTPIDSEAA